MTSVDRLQAMIRLPNYRTDAGSVVAARENTLERFELCVKWGLRTVVDPENHEQVNRILSDLRSGIDTVFRDDHRVQDAREYEYSLMERARAHRGIILLVPKRFFTIRVDLEQPTSELLKIFTALVNRQRKEIKITPRRKKHHGVDPWRVWDMKERDGDSLLKITRTLFQVSGNPAYDEKTKRYYAQVQRAYKKALQMIQEAGLAPKA